MKSLFSLPYSLLPTFSRASTLQLLIGLASLMASSSIMAQTTPQSEVPSHSDTQQVQIQVATSLNSKRRLQLSYPVPVRVEQVLADSLANLDLLPQPKVQTQHQGLVPNTIYWTGAALFERFPHPQKQRIVSQLEQLVNHWKGEKQQAILNLSRQLKELKIGQRVMLPLDYDQVRINSSQNPLVTEDMTLVLPPRPNTVLVVGAVAQPKWLSWQERLSADKYLQQVTQLSNANNSEAWVIQPDGQVEKHLIAYWNQNHMAIAPGATIYLGFSSLPAGFNTLNEDIINLLRNRAL